MNIKRISQAMMFGLLVMSPSSHAANSPAVAKEFDYYITSALKVYLDTIPPSVNTSEIFYNYMERRWQQKKCIEAKECHNLGIRVAHEFAHEYRS